MNIANQTIDPAAHAAAPVPAAAGSSTTAGSQAGATVTANDFLKLLVAEMKNQDPTANTDPNAYINQLVQVNSLQQLIQVNQTLSGMGTVGSSGHEKPAAQAISAASQLATALAPGDSHASTRPAVAPGAITHM